MISLVVNAKTTYTNSAIDVIFFHLSDFTLRAEQTFSSNQLTYGEKTRGTLILAGVGEYLRIRYQSGNLNMLY